MTQHEHAPPAPSTPATWAVLLSRWTDFARASIALPDDDEGEAWRQSVAPAIGLQAISFALAEVGSLPASERALALDVGGVVVRRHAAELHDAWPGAPLPDKLADLIGDARAALEGAAWLGSLWTVDADRLEAPGLDDRLAALCAGGYTGDALAARAGTTLFRGSPALFLTGEPAFDPGERALRRVPGLVAPPQVYRQADEATGRPTRDLVAPFLTALPPGRPLLERVVESGRVVGSTAPRPGAPERLDGPLPVVAQEPEA